MNGTNGDGVLTLILAAIIAIVAWPTIRTSIGRARSITIAIAAALALIICIYDIANVSSAGNEFIEAQVGIGLWMAAGGAGAVLVAMIIGTRRQVVRFSPAVTHSTTTTSPGAHDGISPSNPPRWMPDPTGQHELRYWDGTQWTDHVSDAGVSGKDQPTERQ